MQKRWYEQKGMILLLLTGAVYFFLRYLSPLLAPVLAAGIFLTLCYPAFDDLQKRTGIKKQYMAGTLLILVCVILMGILWWGSAYLFRKIPEWAEGLNGLQETFKFSLTDCCNKLESFFSLETGKLADMIQRQLEISIAAIQDSLLSGIVGNGWNYLKTVLSLFAVLAVTVIATILLARDYDALLAMVGRQRWSMMMLEVTLKVIRYLATYVKAQFLIMLCISLICVIILTIAGIRGSVFLGILAGLLDALPFIGTGIVLIPLAVWQLLSGAFLKAFFCILLYGICALLREFLEPKLIGRQVGVYPFIILISVYAGIRLFGLWGVMKGPVGMVMIWQSYDCICRYIDNKKQDGL